MNQTETTLQKTHGLAKRQINMRIFMKFLVNYTPELMIKVNDPQHQLLVKQCDYEFEKYEEGEENLYFQFSKLVTQRRKELKLLCKDPCPLSRKNKKGKQEKDCKYCTQCNLSLVRRKQ